MSRAPFVFLTDTDPQRWRMHDLCLPARSVATSAAVPARAWFRAANGLGLALARSGHAREAADLMEAAIKRANELAATDPDLIGLGIEAWMNRVDLLKREDPDAGAEALRACYELSAGRAVTRAHTFGLHVGRLRHTGLGTAAPALAILRNRGQAGLLALLLDQGRVADAVAFANTVVTDFPQSTTAGMLHAAEVLARYEPAHPFLRSFDVRTPRTEGDFLVWLRTLRAQSGQGGRLAVSGFGAAVAEWSARATLRNPRTPLLWAVCAAVESDAARSTHLDAGSTAITACVAQADRASHRAVTALVDGRVDRFGLPGVPDVPPEADPVTLMRPLLDAMWRIDTTDGKDRSRDHQ
jgi:hypothetical protein